MPRNSDTKASPITLVLDRIQRGDQNATDELWQLVYQELRKLAAYRLRSDAKHSMRPTELVHEAYVRLVDVDRVPNWSCRKFFFAAAGEAMRRILVDSARSRNAMKRGGGIRRMDLNLDSDLALEQDSTDALLELDEALNQLESHSSLGAAIVKLRFFGGMQHQEVAESLGITRREADREWSVARNWLYRWMRRSDHD